MRRTFSLRFWPVLLGSLFWLVGSCAHAEQMQRIDGYEIHYIALPTTFLNPAIADNYALPRGKDRALVNVSVIDPAGHPVAAQVSGTTKNLLGQMQTLQFKEVREQSAIYYLAILRHSDEEHHRITLTVGLPNGKEAELSMQQKMYWEE